MAASKTLNEALLAVQTAAVKIQKDKVNPAFKGARYASTDAILADLIPVLTENGLVLTQLPTSIGFEDPVPALRTRVTHAATGDYIEDVALLLLDKQNAQGLGGGITYMRRYAVTSMFALVTDPDDDGNKASEIEVVNPLRPSRRRSRAAAPKPEDDDTSGY